MKNLKNQKGITLVALVVTIIVLLILAGVSLSLVAGSEGILGKASNAVDKNQIATIKERVDMKVAEEVENYYEAKYVDRTIDNSLTALDYLKGKDIDQIKTADLTIPADKTETSVRDEMKKQRTEFKDGNATYVIKYDEATREGSTDKYYTIAVQYTKGNTTIDGTAVSTDKSYSKELTGEITKNGAITWNSDLKK